MKSTKTINGPKNKGLSDLYFKYIKSQLPFLQENERKYPGISKFRLLIFTLYHLTSPKHIKHVLQKNNRNYVKGFDQKPMKQVLGEGLLTNEGDEWREKRKYIQPFFYRKKMPDYFDNMLLETQSTIRALAQQPKDVPIDIHKVVGRLTLQIVSKCLFDFRVDHDLDEALRELLNRTYDQIVGTALPLWIPTKANRNYKRHREEVEKVVQGIMEKIPDSEAGTFLNLFKNGKASGCPFSKKQTKDEIMTLFLAGHETTANALAFTIYLLSQNPAEETKLRQELDQVLKGQAPTFDNIQELVYTQKVVCESLRLFPPVWGTTRHALTDDHIDGYKIPRKKIINISPYVMHRSPRFWDAPETFNPDRFDKEQDRYVYLPFGGGPRKCLGEHFAMMEMILVIALFYQRFSFRHDTTRPIKLSPKITLRSKTGVWGFVEHLGGKG